MTVRSWQSKADAHWATETDCEKNEFFELPVRLKAHGEAMADYNGIYALFREGRVIVSFPKDRMGLLASGLPGDRLSPDLFAAHFGNQGYRVIGPAFIGYTTSIGEIEEGARALDASDQAAAESLRADCRETEWDHGGSNPAEQPCSGVFDEGRLAALAGYEVWSGTIAHLSVVTHPAFRGRGHGRRAVAHLAARALEAGLVAQYRTLEANTASMRIAAGLGFDCYATSVAVRLS